MNINLKKVFQTLSKKQKWILVLSIPLMFFQSFAYFVGFGIFSHNAYISSSAWHVVDALTQKPAPHNVLEEFDAHLHHLYQMGYSDSVADLIDNSEYSKLSGVERLGMLPPLIIPFDQNRLDYGFYANSYFAGHEKILDSAFNEKSYFAPSDAKFSNSYYSFNSLYTLQETQVPKVTPEMPWGSYPNEQRIHKLTMSIGITREANTHNFKRIVRFSTTSTSSPAYHDADCVECKRLAESITEQKAREYSDAEAEVYVNANIGKYIKNEASHFTLDNPGEGSIETIIILPNEKTITYTQSLKEFIDMHKE